jgi:cadmium resistance protein CadD (predicted permease)
VSDLPATMLAAVGLFVATNLDNLIVLVVLYLSAHAGGVRRWAIPVGQYVGALIVLTTSAVAAAGLVVVPREWVGLIGLIPMTLGVRGLWQVRNGAEERDHSTGGSGLGSVIAVTVANGGDNISVYTAAFRTLDVRASVITFLVALAIVGPWCLVGSYLARHRRVAAMVDRAGHILVPVAFIAVGAVILVRSGTAGRVATLLW